MANYRPQPEFEDTSDQVSMTRVAQWGGALISVALIIGMAFWAYKIVVRDVSGIPVVRASEDPLRIQPENPGGREADHQGFAVNDVVSDGTASPSAQTLILAPDPQELTVDDAPFGELPLGEAEEAEIPTIGEATTEAEQREAVLGLADQLIAEQQEETPEPSENEAILAAVLEASNTADATGAPSSSPFPRLRPVISTTATAAPSSPSLPVTDVAASDVPDGSRLVQLGAFQSEAVAQSEWERMSNLFPGYLDDKSRVIQQAESGGKIFYRLRAMGFEDIDDARRFCAAFKSRNVDCVPVLVR